MKRCADCRQWKAREQFTNNRSRPDGLCVYCRECYRARMRRLYRRKRERMGKTLRVRPEVPAGHKYCPTCKTIRPHTQWHRSKRTKDGLSSQCKHCRVDGGRRTHLKRMYALTPEDVEAMLLAQGGVCAICEGPMERPHVDHDHKTGKVRGIFCFNCNAGLGKFQDDVEVVQLAVEYLRRHG